jgi:predicted enzyme related to lactoylglutathione lyase
MAGTNAGRFAWYELMTSDPKAAVAFYTEVVGWKAEPWEGPDYTMFVGSQGPLGGTMQRPGPEPQWMSNVLVDDVDAASAKVKKLGGRVLSEPSDMPKIGRFSVVADPQGATIALFKPESGEMALHDETKAGEFDWNELLTTDQNAAFAFYSEICGWKKLREHDMGPMGTYLIYGIGGKELGGIFTKAAEMVQLPTAWTYYVNVSDIEAAGKRAAAKGGKILRGPMEVPGGSRIIQLLDPQGAMFALHEPARARQ